MAASGPLTLFLAGRLGLLAAGVRQPMRLVIHATDRAPTEGDGMADYVLIPASDRDLDPSAWVVAPEGDDGAVAATQPMETWRFELWTGTAYGVLLLGPGGALWGAGRFPTGGYRIDGPQDALVVSPALVWPAG